MPSYQTIGLAFNSFKNDRLRAQRQRADMVENKRAAGCLAKYAFLAIGFFKIESYAHQLSFDAGLALPLTVIGYARSVGYA